LLYGTDKISVMAIPRLLLSNARPAARASRAAREIACLVLLVESIMWIAPMVKDERAARLGLTFMTIVLLVACYVRDKATARELGFRLDNFFSVLKRLRLPLGAFILMAVAIGQAAGTLRFGARFYSMLITVPLWALLQQYMLLAFANSRLRVLTGEGRSAAATAALFALLHFPNPILMIVCAAGGYIWARAYEREPNLFANALTHTLASAVLANSLPGSLLKNMVVGYNFFFR
jgi:hypothetical protein